MANSTTNLELIDVNQSQKEVTANSLFDAASPAMLYGRHAEACIGLTWGWYGGKKNDGTSIVDIPNDTILLDASTTNYLEIDNDGVVYKVTGSPTLGRVLLYTIVTGVSSVTSYTDWRNGTQGIDFDAIGVPPVAADIGVTDAGNYFTGTDVEAVLQEIGATILTIDNIIDPSVTTEAFSTTLNLDADDYEHNEVIAVTLTNDITINLSASSNTPDAKKLVFRLRQDGTGGHTVTLNAGFAFGTDITTYVGESTANLTDYIGVIYNLANGNFDILAVVKGY